MKGVLMMKRKVLSLLGLLMLTLILTQTAAAYTFMAYEWEKEPDNTLYVGVMWGDRLDDGDSLIKNAFKAAISDWHKKQNHIRYSITSTSANELNSYFLSSDTAYGYCTVNYNKSTGYTNWFEAYVNAGNSNISDANVAQSAASHELGHSYGLDHSAETAVMNTSRNRGKIYTAQTDDVNGVNAKYK
jgi:hypothetical protein